MPDEAYWETFFDANTALDRLLPDGAICGDVVEFGCGYGTFTLPAARRVFGIVTALDIEAEMVATVTRKAEAARLGNIRGVLRDFVADGTGLRDASQSHAMIFNLLHLEEPIALLREARRVLGKGGSLSVIHWRSDIPTPRGPSSAIRPSPEQCRAWMEDAGFRGIESVDLRRCCPYHFGLFAQLQ
ncbi:class I SAM-dependent methyltransferase [Zoogloea sp.]|uniref:class I SAM-dependent methyltransferase n=1 Tax=Zoogloea sp. TaxID=49181 RepID=UPI0035B4865B